MLVRMESGGQDGGAQGGAQQAHPPWGCLPKEATGAYKQQASSSVVTCPFTAGWPGCAMSFPEEVMV